MGMGRRIITESRVTLWKLDRSLYRWRDNHISMIIVPVLALLLLLSTSTCTRMNSGATAATQ